MKKFQIALLVLLALAAAITVGCGTSSSKTTTLPTFTKLPFLSNRTVDPATPMFIANLDGSTITGIPTNGGSWTYSPSISADLKVVAFASDSEIWVTNSTGMTPVQVTNNITNSLYSFFVKVSPDGTKLLYSVYDGTSYHLKIMNPDGTGSLDLTPTPPTGMTDCYSGSFSADGSKIVFTCTGNSNGGAYIINPDGTGFTTVFTQSAAFLDTALLTPDGSKVLFVLYNNGPGAAAARRSLKTFPHLAFRPQTTPTSVPANGLVSVNLDGTGLTSVAAGAYDGVILNSTLYYTLYDTNLSLDQIYKANLDGSGAVSISDGTASDYLGVSAD